MLIFTAKAYAKLEYLLELSVERAKNYEIHGFGRVTLQRNGVILCDDVDMPEQKAASVHISTDGQDYAKWQAERFQLKPGMTDEEIAKASEEMSRWRLWWHKHPSSVGASYSSTDVETLQDLAESVDGYFLGLVILNDMTSMAYVAYHQPVRLPTTQIGAADVYIPLSTEEQDLCDAIFDRVDIKVTPSQYNPASWQSSWYGQDDETTTASTKGGKAKETKTPATDDRSWEELYRPDPVPPGMKFSRIVGSSGNAMAVDGLCLTCYGRRISGKAIHHQGAKTTTTYTSLCEDCDKPERYCNCVWDVIVSESESRGITVEQACMAYDDISGTFTA